VRFAGTGSIVYKNGGVVMGILLLILAAFFIMGGFHVIAYTAFLCAIFFAIFILPAILITKLIRA
jgi:predicted RND superfamily exporter protein